MGGTAPEAVRAARIGNLLQCLALLGCALFLCGGAARSRFTMLGIGLAVTPMAAYLAATVSSSGLEVMASIAFFAGLQRVGRDGGRLAWGLTAAVGSALALSRTLGPVWVLLDVALWVAVIGPRPAWGRIREHPWRGGLAAAALVTSIVLNRAWEQAYGARTKVSPIPGLSDLPFGDAPHLLREAIGIFGYLELPVPLLGSHAWTLALLVLFALAVRLGSLRDSSVTWLTGAVCLLFPAYLSAAVLRYTAFTAQGRYFLPLFVLFPMILAAVLQRSITHWQRRSVTRLVLVCAGVTGVVHFAAWEAAGHRYAVGTAGPRWFPSVAQWTPPGNWVFWAATCVAGAALLVAVLALSDAHPADTAVGADGPA